LLAALPVRLTPHFFNKLLHTSVPLRLKCLLLAIRGRRLGKMEKRKFLFVSLSGLIGDIAWQIVKEGHEVRYYIDNEKERDIADGFVPKSTNWEKDVDWADVIVFDDTLGQGEKAVGLRARGKAVVGGTPYTDRLEDDRSFGQEELKKAGVTIIPYRDFDNFDEAIAYVQENPTRYVIKPSGAAGNVKRRLFVGDEEDGGDVVRMLEAYKKAFSDEIKVFQLQKRVTGVEVAVGGFFNGKEFATPINVNFDTLDEVHLWSMQILTTAGPTKPTMPPAGGPSPDERKTLEAWINCGAD